MDWSSHIIFYKTIIARQMELNNIFASDKFSNDFEKRKFKLNVNVLKAQNVVNFMNSHFFNGIHFIICAWKWYLDWTVSEAFCNLGFLELKLQEMSSIFFQKNWNSRKVQDFSQIKPHHSLETQKTIIYNHP